MTCSIRMRRPATRWLAAGAWGHGAWGQVSVPGAKSCIQARRDLEAAVVPERCSTSKRRTARLTVESCTAKKAAISCMV